MPSIISLKCGGSYTVDATPEEVVGLRTGFFRLTRGEEVAIFLSDQVGCVATYANPQNPPWEIELYDPAMAAVG